MQISPNQCGSEWFWYQTGTYDLDDIKKRFEFIKSLGPAVKRVDVLKYHTLGEGKYYSLGMEYPIAPGTVCSDEFIDKVSEIADMVGVPINIEN